MSALATEPVMQGWDQMGQLAVAFALSALIGLERELKQRAAGIRTYTVVGFASAVFMLVSKYGFTDVLVPGQVMVDPSRVAAQIVSGLGFIGGGIIFVRRGSVRGLTTAASVWLTAAIGAAAGSGLEQLACLATAGYFIAVLVLPVLARFVARRVVTPWPTLTVHYLDGHGLLRDVLAIVTQSGFAVAGLNTSRSVGVYPRSARRENLREESAVEVKVLLSGRGDLQLLIASLSELEGVLRVATDHDGEPDD